MSNCKYCGIEISGYAGGGHVTWCDKNPNVNEHKKKIGNAGRGRKPSEETKKKISMARKKYLDEHPDQVPYRLYHSSGKSWPEMTFEKYLNKNEIKGWFYNYQFGRYSLDFAFPEWKLDVEIDGNTHKLENVKRIDVERDKFVRASGWTVVRITASEIRNNVYDCINRVLLIIKYPKLIEIPQEFLNKRTEKNLRDSRKKEELELKRIKRENDKINKLKIPGNRDGEYKKYNDKRKAERYERVKESKQLKIELSGKRLFLINSIISDYGNRFGVVNKIAESLNVSHTSARRICKKLNIKLNTDRIWTEEMKKNVSLKLIEWNKC